MQGVGRALRGKRRRLTWGGKTERTKGQNGTKTRTMGEMEGDIIETLGVVGLQGLFIMIIVIVVVAATKVM